MATHRFVMGAMFILAASFQTQARAALITYEFGATVRAIEAVGGNQQVIAEFLAGFGVSTDTMVTGSYTYDTSVSGSNVGGRTRYTGAITRFEIQLGDLVYLFGEGGDPSASNWIAVDDNGSDGDFWQAFSIIDIGLPGFGSSIFELTLVDESGQALDGSTSDQLGPGLEAFDSFDPSAFFDTSVNGVLLLPPGVASVDMSLDFHRVVVPLPAAGWLMFGALGVLGLGRSGREKS